MYTSYTLEAYGRARMQEHLDEAEHERLVAALPRRPRGWALGTLKLRRWWPGSRAASQDGDPG